MHPTITGNAWRGSQQQMTTFFPQKETFFVMSLRETSYRRLVCYYYVVMSHWFFIPYNQFRNVYKYFYLTICTCRKRWCICYRNWNTKNTVCSSFTIKYCRAIPEAAVVPYLKQLLYNISPFLMHTLILHLIRLFCRIHWLRWY